MCTVKFLYNWQKVQCKTEHTVSHNAMRLTSVKANWPRGTTISASLMVGSMYCSKAGFTNLLYCLITPSMSRPRFVMSLLSLRTSRMSESVSTKIFISSNWNTGHHWGGEKQAITRLWNILWCLPSAALYLQMTWCPQYNDAGPIHRFLQADKHSLTIAAKFSF